MASDSPAPPQDADYVERVAYHEAGHAAIAFHLRRAVKWISIIPGEREGTAGQVQLMPCPNWLAQSLPGGTCLTDTRLRPWVEREVMLASAGHVAVFILMKDRGGIPLDDYSPRDTDTKQAIAHAKRWCFDQEEAERFVEWLATRTRKILTHQWPSVDALAQALLVEKKISGRRARQIWLESFLK